MPEEFHSSLLGGHSGIRRTFGRLQENVFWESMRKDVTEFVRNCVICQQMKTTNLAPYGLLQPFPVPNKYLQKLYINTTFIPGDLDEEVYMKVPLDFKVSNKNLIRKLNKYIYGLK